MRCQPLFHKYPDPGPLLNIMRSENTAATVMWGESRPLKQGRTSSLAAVPTPPCCPLATLPSAQRGEGLRRPRARQDTGGSPTWDQQAAEQGRWGRGVGETGGAGMCSSLFVFWDRKHSWLVWAGAVGVEVERGCLMGSRCSLGVMESSGTRQQ